MAPLLRRACRCFCQVRVYAYEFSIEQAKRQKGRRRGVNPGLTKDGLNEVVQTESDGGRSDKNTD